MHYLKLYSCFQNGILFRFSSWPTSEILRKRITKENWRTEKLIPCLICSWMKQKKKTKHRVTESVARKDPYLLKSHKSRAKGLIFVILCRYWWRSHMVNIFSSGALNNFSCDSTFRYLVWNTTIRIVVMISFKGFVTVRSMYYWIITLV